MVGQISLSSDGSTVTIDARYNDDYGNNSGHVRIYEFQSNNSWSQLGSDINGETANDESGFSVSLSSDGWGWLLVYLTMMQMDLILVM